MALKLLQLLLLISISTISSMAFGSDFSELYGATVNVGAAKAGDRQGEFAELSYFLGFFGASIEAKRLGDEEINGAFLAIGFTYLLQAQVGETNYGATYRFKSEFTPHILFPRSSAPLSSPDRITFNLGYERIPSESSLNNYSIGIGYVFN